MLRDGIWLRSMPPQRERVRFQARCYSCPSAGSRESNGGLSPTVRPAGVADRGSSRSYVMHGPRRQPYAMTVSPQACRPSRQFPGAWDSQTIQTPCVSPLTPEAECFLRTRHRWRMRSTRSTRPPTPRTSCRTGASFVLRASPRPPRPRRRPAPSEPERAGRSAVPPPSPVRRPDAARTAALPATARDRGCAG